MSVEAQYAAEFLAYSARVNAVIDGALTVHPWAPYGIAAAAVGGLLAAGRVLHPSSPSIHPSASTRVHRVDSRRPDRRLRGGSGGRPERINRRKEPPRKRFTVPGLVPHGPRPRRYWRWGLPPWGWERKGYVTAILGVGGVGKSFVLEDLGIAALTGGRWFGLEVLPARTVLYVDAELDVEECERRAHPLARGRGYEEPPAGLHYLNITGDTLAPVKEKGGDGVEVEYQPGIERIRAVARRLKPDLILLDSLTIGSVGATASDEKAWNKIYSALETFGCPVVAIDHMDKAGKSAYGSFMKQAKVRSCVKMTRRGESLLIQHDKINFGPLLPPFAVYAEFGDEDDPDYVVRFGTEPPSIHQEEPSVDGQNDAPEITPGGAALMAYRPAGTSSTAAGHLKVVPPAGAEGTRLAVFQWVRAHAGAGLTRQQIVKAIAAAGLYQPATTQLHLKALLEAGLLVDDGGILRVREAPKEATG